MKFKRRTIYAELVKLCADRTTFLLPCKQTRVHDTHEAAALYVEPRHEGICVHLASLSVRLIKDSLLTATKSHRLAGGRQFLNRSGVLYGIGEVDKAGTIMSNKACEYRR